MVKAQYLIVKDYVYSLQKKGLSLKDKISLQILSYSLEISLCIMEVQWPEYYILKHTYASTSMLIALGPISLRSKHHIGLINM